MREKLHRSFPRLFFVACTLLGLALLAPAQHSPRGAAPLTLGAGDAFAADAELAAPSQKDKCPVCGMFVAKYPDFACSITFRDGSAVFFDGAKDLFKYYFDLKRYHPSRRKGDIASITVTDYYSLRYIDGRKASYVAGSNIYGPMGKELIPFEKEADAKTFMVDHVGKFLYRFKDITPAVIKELD